MWDSMCVSIDRQVHSLQQHMLSFATNAVTLCNHRCIGRRGARCTNAAFLPAVRRAALQRRQLASQQRLLCGRVAVAVLPIRVRHRRHPPALPFKLQKRPVISPQKRAVQESCREALYR